MKKKFLLKIIAMSKYAFYGLFLQSLLAGMLIASSGSAQSGKKLSEISLSFQGKQMTLMEAFRQIERKTGFTFIYNDAVVDEGRVVEINAKQTDLYNLLGELSLRGGVQFKRINNNIFVTTQSANVSASQRVEEVEPVQVRVSGKVISGDDQQPLPGVSIVVKGTTTGTTTDMNGAFSLTAPEGTMLVFSYIGFVTQEIAVGAATELNVVMKADLAQLQEVVVIGYGERDKKDLTGAISNVKSEDIAKSVALQPELAMQGRMTGVFVSTPGGEPNARPQVRIRGVGTFGYAEPLYVIDGVPVTEFGSGVDGGLVGDIRGNVNVLNLINPGDIESISVLKDASSAAIYGVRASNGVILITTKRGKSGRPRIEFNGQRGVQNLVGTFDMLNTQEFTALYQEAYANNPNEANTLPDQFRANHPSFLGNSPTYDWQDALINRNAVTEDYSMRMSGGNEATTYYVSLGYNYVESPLKANNSTRYSLATNIKSKVSDKVEAGLTYRFAYLDALDNTRGDLAGVARTSPWQPIYDPNGPLGFAPSNRTTFLPNPQLSQPFNGNRPIYLGPIPAFVVDQQSLLYGPETNDNVFAQQAINNMQYSLIRNLGTGYIQVEPLKGLKVKGTLSADWFYNRRNEWQGFDRYLFSQAPGNPYERHDGTSAGSYGERHARNYNLVGELSVMYTKAFGEHNVDVLLNAMDQRYGYEFLQGGSTQNVSADPLFRGITNVEPYASASSFRDRYALQGYMARASYRYSNKYYLDVTVRRDGSSRFAPGYKWGTFPSVSAAWRVSSEQFMASMDFINDLKIRGGYGELGNQETGNFAFLSKVSLSPDYAFGSGNGNGVGSIGFGASLPDFPVRDLSWERAKTINLGFDAILLNNRVTFTAEYYRRTTEGILQSSNLPASVGNQNQPILNIATVRNSGIELEIGYNTKVGPVDLNFSGNITTVRNRAVAVFRDQPFGGEQGRIEEGFPLFYLWGFKTGGIFQNQAEIDAWRQIYSDGTNSNRYSPGDMWFQDVNKPATEEGKTYAVGGDSIVNLLDRTYLGKTIPGYFYGFNMSANFKGFDLSIFFQGVGDVQRVNGERWAGESMSSRGVNQWRTVLNRWTDQNPSTTMPRAVFNDLAGNNRFSDRWVEDAGFMRLKNIQIGYSLPGNLLQKTGVVERMRIFVSGTNLLTFTDWTGVDPENDIIPPTRTIMAGVSASF